MLLLIAMVDSNNIADENQSKLTSFGRRDILRTVASGASITGLTTIGSANEPTVEIVIARRDGEPSRTKEVPKDWCNHVEKVKRLRKQFQSSRTKNGLIHRFGIGLGNNVISGRKKRLLTAHIEPGKSTDVSLPEEVEGVQIERREIASAEDMIEDVDCSPDDHCDTESYNPVPGGTNIRNPESNQGFTAGAAIDFGDEEMMVTCAHAYIKDDQCDGDSSYWSTTVGDSEIYMGFPDTDIGFNRHLDITFIKNPDHADIDGVEPEVKTGQSDTINVATFFHGGIGWQHSRQPQPPPKNLGQKRPSARGFAPHRR